MPGVYRRKVFPVIPTPSVRGILTGLQEALPGEWPTSVSEFYFSSSQLHELHHLYFDLLSLTSKSRLSQAIDEIKYLDFFMRHFVTSRQVQIEKLLETMAGLQDYFGDLIVQICKHNESMQRATNFASSTRADLASLHSALNIMASWPVDGSRIHDHGSIRHHDILNAAAAINQEEHDSQVTLTNTFDKVLNCWNLIIWLWEDLWHIRPDIQNAHIEGFIPEFSTSVRSKLHTLRMHSINAEFTNQQSNTESN